MRRRGGGGGKDSREGRESESESERVNVRQWRKRRTRKGKGTLRKEREGGRQTEDDKVKERSGMNDEKWPRKQTAEKRKSSEVLKKRQYPQTHTHAHHPVLNLSAILTNFQNKRRR